MMKKALLKKIGNITLLGILLYSPIGFNSHAASFEFSPSIANATNNCPFEIDLIIDPQGSSVNAADIRIDFNPNEIIILDYDTSTPNINLKPGNAFDNFYAISVNSTSGQIVFAGDNVNTTLTERRVFASILLRNQSNILQTHLTIYFTGVGATLDSNIGSAVNSSDLLAVVLNAQINFSSEGTCGQTDSAPPEIFLVSPSVDQEVINTNSPIVINLIDNSSGIDLSTLVIIINGIEFSADSPWIQISGTPNNYVITITPPPGLLSPGEIVQIEISVSDFDGNTRTENFSYTVSGLMTEASSFDANLTLNLLPLVAPFAGLLSFFLLLISGVNLIGLIAKLFALFIGRRDRPWGVILDIDTGKPISLATCRLFYQNSSELISSTISNLDGTYGFALKSGGEYNVEVTKEGYQPFTTRLSIPDDVSGYVYDIYMSQIDSEFLSRLSFRDKVSLRTTKFIKSLGSVLFIFGFASSIFATLISPILWNFSIVSLYVFVAILSIWLFYYGRNRLSIILNSITSKPIPHAVIKLYSIEEKKNLDTLVAGSDGTFDYFGEPGSYGAIVLCKGYTFPSIKQNDLELLAEMYSGMLKLNLQKGRNKFKILMDPIEGYQRESSDSRLTNPFS